MEIEIISETVLQNRGKLLRLLTNTHANFQGLNHLWRLSWMFAGQEWQVVLRRVSCQRPKSEREVNVGLFL